jgi:hypothetical protein
MDAASIPRMALCELFCMHRILEFVSGDAVAERFGKAL